ncbi:MAG: hypothetical protein IKH61_00280 [Bacteroidales bacterium]|nr:hypothetical protein [Bacteroidales bacterium]
MTTMTVHVPAMQEGWFMQMLRSMGWGFSTTEVVEEPSTENEISVSEKRAKQLDQLLKAVRTEAVADISEQEIIDECKAVRKEMYEASKQAN